MQYRDLNQRRCSKRLTSTRMPRTLSTIWLAGYFSAEIFTPSLTASYLPLIPGTLGREINGLACDGWVVDDPAP